MCQDIQQKFDSVEGFENLWRTLLLELKQYKISSVFYGCGFDNNAILNQKYITYDSIKTTNLGNDESTFIELIPGFIKTNHTREYLEYFDKNFTVLDDYNAYHCMVSEEPLFWHHEETWIDKVDERQLKFMEESARFGMEVGVTVPIRFGSYGVGGFGLNYDGEREEFDAQWDKEHPQILAILDCFDKATRKSPNNSFYQLSTGQIELLRNYRVHASPKKAVHMTYGDISKSMAYKHFAKLRETLGVHENLHALLKAQEFNLI